MSAPARLRCAVYTRKSTEEGLEQEFNSLDAQREACVAFIASQASLGWKLAPGHYDDGGISGGTMERPALQRLLQEIRDRRIDVVVVYKIDRLTRSLMDFARIVEIFDASNVSFVSVTQQFNTTTSMGRLTLNVLLSFAQFEREVTAERIRDKIAASKKKGMWMGGRVPLGYQVKDRKLLVNELEAKAVRHLFKRYLELKSVLALTEEVNRQNALEREKLAESETPRAMQPFTRGKLYYLLSNQIYIGKLKHHNRHFEGEHEPIIDAELFEAVQTLLAIQRQRKKGASGAADIHLLTGILFDEVGDRLSPAHATKQGKRYRYYISNRLKIARSRKDGGWRAPAAELEAVIDQQLQQLLIDRARLADWVQRIASTSEIETVLEAARTFYFENVLRMSPVQKKALIHSVFRRITLGSNTINFQVDPRAVVAALLDRPAPNMPTGEKVDGLNADKIPLVSIDVPLLIKRRGVEARLVIQNSSLSVRSPDRALIDLVARANLYLTKLTDGTNRSIADVAQLCGVHRADVSRVLPVAFLAPSIVEAILAGQQPVELSARRLSRTDLPLNWQEQNGALDF